jgi:hypothetical protein
MSDKLILRTSVSPYGDTTKGSVLSAQELDGNLITLKGAQISSVSLIGNSLNVVELNGSNFNVDLSQFTNDTTITGGTFANSTLILSNNTGGTVTITGFTMTAQSETYTNLTATTTTIGGIPAGSTFSGLTMQQMWDKLLYPYQPPAFTTFSFTYLNPQTSNIFEVGTGIIDFTNSNFTYATSNATNVSAGTITITQNYPSTITIKSGLDGSSNNTSIPQAQFTNQPIIISSSTATTRTIFTISGKNTNLGDMSATISASWQSRVYVGPLGDFTTATANQITGITPYYGLQSSFVGSYTIPIGSSSYIYFCYPDYMPTIKTAILNGTLNLPLAAQDAYYNNSSNGFYYHTLNITNAFGITQLYKVYRTANKLAGGTITFT